LLVVSEALKMRDITRQNKEFAESQLKKLADKANKVDFSYTPVDTVIVEADLKSFSVVDDGTPYLKVSHPAAQDATIGVVSKSEYETGNKEALLTSVLQSKFAEFSNSHALHIVGSFVEPTIQPAPKEEVIIVPIEKKASEEKPFEPRKEIESDLPLLRSADSFRQNIEAAAAREQETFNRFITATVNDLVSYVKSLHYDEPKIVEAVDSSNLTLNDSGINGHIVVSTSLIADGPRVLNIGIPVTASKAVFPNADEMKELVSKSIDVNAKVLEEFSKEILAGLDRVDAEVAYQDEQFDFIINEKTAELTKTASDYTDGISSTSPGAHIKLQKHLLPGEFSNYEVGDTIYSDGKKWKLVSKGDGVDSNDKNEGSASLWDFVECLPEEGSKEPKADIPR